MRITAEDLLLLGVTTDMFAHVQRAGSLAEANQRLEDIKRNARRALRLATLDLHPDRTGGDEEKTDRLKKLTAIYDTLKKAVIVVRQPPPPVVFVRRQWTAWAATSDSTSSVTGTWGGW